MSQGLTEERPVGVGSVPGDVDPADPSQTAPAAQADSLDPRRDRRRFVIAALCASMVAAVPYVWFLTSDWTGQFLPLRGIQFFSDFYDLQAQAMMHGHLWVPTGSLGIEGFIHNGHTYTYFGLLLSVLRMPFLLISPTLKGRLTAPSMMVAWALTALVTSMLIWRVRVLLRGSATLGMAETVSLGILVAAVQGGSVLLLLGAAPWVYTEDLVWSVPITVATLFVFIGILDRPSWRRVLAAGALVLAGVLSRPSPALACVVGALLIAAWFALGRGGAEQRRWAVPMALVGVIPELVTVTVNYLKFGTLINGLPLAHQVWTRDNAHRRAFLAATGGKGYSFHFLPTTIWAYLQPFGLRAEPTFPWLTLPIQPPHVYGGFTVDIIYPTGSVPATMPLLFLLACVGIVVAIRGRPGRGAALLRIPLLVAIGATLVDFLLGYIAPRYLADFMPFLILGSAIGMIELWRHLADRGNWARYAAVAVVAVLAAFGFFVNAGIASSPVGEWSTTQAANYVRMIQSTSNSTDHSLATQVERGSTLPYWAPQNEVFVAGNCGGLYLSTGLSYATVPTSQAEHTTWLPVEQGPGIVHVFDVTYRAPLSGLGAGTTLFTVGRDRILVEPVGGLEVRFVLDDPRFGTHGQPTGVGPHHAEVLTVITDPYLHLLEITLPDGQSVLKSVLSYPGAQPVIAPGDSGSGSPASVTGAAARAPDLSICHSLIRSR